MNEFQEGLADTPARTSAERHVELLRQQGGLSVEAVRVTRMPMVVTDPTLPGNPITFANAAFMNLSGNCTHRHKRSANPPASPSERELRRTP